MRGLDPRVGRTWVGLSGVVRTSRRGITDIILCAIGFRASVSGVAHERDFCIYLYTTITADLLLITHRMWRGVGEGYLRLHDDIILR